MRFQSSSRLSVVLLLAILPLRFTSAIEELEEECSVYLAESSIKNGGWGVFAGKEFNSGDLIGIPGLGIQVTDGQNINDLGAINEFFWEAGQVGGFNEAERVSTALPGIGMLVNYHPLFDNIVAGGLAKEHLFDRGTDPEAGATTLYHNFSFVAKIKIYPGQELFGGVSDDWFQRWGMPVKADYGWADSIVMGLMHFRNDHPDLTEAQLIDILYRMKTEMIQGNHPVAKLIPSSLEELDDAGTKRVATAELMSAQHVKRSGRCLDNIKPGISTIPGAGRGAFATRFIAKGTVIAPAPLVQVMDKASFKLATETADNATQQLLLNYCFGHRKSPLLLCPTTHVSLINHKSDGPNAEYRWAPSSSNRSDKDTNYVLGSLEELQTNRGDPSSFNSRLMFEFIAKEDIKPGEEIFIDYGDEWETAWKTHMKQWQRPDSANSYIPASVMNAEERPITLSADSTHHSYECRLEPMADEERAYHEVFETEYRSNPSINPENWRESYRIWYLENNKEMVWWPCEVIEVVPDNTRFRTIVYTKGLEERRVFRRLTNVPRSAIRFVDKPYHSDQFLSSSFRHFIPMPDSIFPLRWRSDYSSAESVRLGIKNPGIDVKNEENRHHVSMYEESLRKAKCGIYFAPSNIPNAGFGTYTAVPLVGNGIILGTTLPVIPVPNLMPEGERWDGDDYVWSGQTHGCEFEAEKEISALAVQDGALANSHTGLWNLAVVKPIFDPMLDRRKDPGAGAFSDYVEYAFESKQAFSVGEELFVSHGEEWFSNREYFRHVPLLANYEESNRILASLWSLSTLEGSGLDGPSVEGLLNLAKTAVVSTKNHRTRIALEQVNSMSDLEYVISRNGTAEAGTEFRSLEWFEKNGQCLDHIFVQNSTIAQAGKGAFSRRHLKKGDIVISAPLMTTWGRHMFDMNSTIFPDGIKRKQLLFNYQFAHPDSSVLFFPINTVIAINHNSGRSKTGRPANAELRWSTWNKKSSYFLQRPLDELKKEHYSTMVLDIVATRDIVPDEEVFIDYGEEWEIAWDEHVRNFEPPCKGASGPCFKSSKVVKAMNYDKFNTMYHAWSDDHFTVCDTEFMPSTDDVVLMKNDPPEKGVGTLQDAGVDFDHLGFNLTRIDSSHCPCLISVGDEKRNIFDVVYFINTGSGAHVLRRQKELPADAIMFINKPYTSDMYWPNAFRHEIKIPDEIFPPLWKDLV